MLLPMLEHTILKSLGFKRSECNPALSVLYWGSLALQTTPSSILSTVHPSLCLVSLTVAYSFETC